jgi:hypothetical protein
MNAHESPKYGYWYYPPESKHAPGGNRLDIILVETPTGQHFDPQFVNLPVKKGEVMENLKIHHPWKFGSAYQVCAGRVRIIDRKGKIEEAFSFGGELTVQVQDTLTACTLKSPAPILEFTEIDPIKLALIDEVEILLAKRKVDSLANPMAFEGRLANAEPFTLYLAALNALINKFDNEQHSFDPLVIQFSNFLHDEYKRLKNEGYIPFSPPKLEEIL